MPAGFGVVVARRVRISHRARHNRPPEGGVCRKTLSQGRGLFATPSQDRLRYVGCGSDGSGWARWRRRSARHGCGGDARAGLPHRRHARRAAVRPVDPAAAPRDAGRDARAPVRPAAAGRAGLRGDHRAPRARRPAVHEPRRPSGLLRLHPLLRDLAGRAGRLRRERLQRVRRLVDGVRRPDAARARGAGLVQGVDRLSRRTPAGSSSAAARRRTSPRWPARASRSSAR